MQLEYEGYTEGTSGRVLFARDVVYIRSSISLTPARALLYIVGG